MCDASPHGVTRLLAWAVEVRAIAGDVPVVVVVNRAPAARFRRGELYAEITDSLAVHDVVFAPHDGRVADAAWDGIAVGRGSFTRAIDPLAPLVASLPRRRRGLSVLEEAS